MGRRKRARNAGPGGRWPQYRDGWAGLQTGGSAWTWRPGERNSVTRKPQERHSKKVCRLTEIYAPIRRNDQEEVHPIRLQADRLTCVRTV